MTEVEQIPEKVLRSIQAAKLQGACSIIDDLW